MYVSVLINRPAYELNQGYAYKVPPALEKQADLGKRVLVDFNGQIAEGFIIEFLSGIAGAGLKADKDLIKVLDREPLFDRNLLQLAQWMAERYTSPLISALKLMVPAKLTARRTVKLIPLINEVKADSHPLVITRQEFFNRLIVQGGMTLATALKYMTKNELKDLKQANLVFFGGDYSPAIKPDKNDIVYSLSRDWQEKIKFHKIRKNSQQEKIIELLNKYVKIGQIQLEKDFSAYSLKALQSKNIIIKEQRERILPELAGPLPLNSGQEQALQEIIKALDRNINDFRRGKSSITPPEYQPEEFLLFGVTGSGKTEIYLQAAQHAINGGQTVLVLVPEIALTRHLLQSFMRRIPRVSVLHSMLTDTERYEQWYKIKNGLVDVVLGTRSAVFAPLPRLGLIIMDEEQEYTYKNEETPKYHVRDIVRRRAYIEKATVVLGSATPMAESFYRAMQGESKLLQLPYRAKGAAAPVVDICDMRRNRDGVTISSLLAQKIERVLDLGQQCILFVNRRGYSTMTLCRECGMIATCINCSVAMIYHEDINRYICHYCNYQTDKISLCPHCGSHKIADIGYGTQRVEAEAREKFPHARIQRLDLDNSGKKGFQESVLHQMQTGAINILIGTQMVAKGMDFPKVSLVGIISPEMMLNLPDFRAAERAFQLMLQAAGRAGRAHIPGEVLIQTYNPEHALLTYVRDQDYWGFYLEEIKKRRILDYPPFKSLLRVVVSNTDNDEAQKKIGWLAGLVEEITDAQEDDMVLLGPAPCPISKIRNRYRYQFHVKSGNLSFLLSIARYLTINNTFSEGDKIEIDIDPLFAL